MCKNSWSWLPGEGQIPASFGPVSPQVTRGSGDNLPRSLSTSSRGRMVLRAKEGPQPPLQPQWGRG